jgi:uncharacterized membrane protein
MGPDPSNWHASARRLAMTALVVAIALYLAIHLIEAVATVLVILGAIGALAYVLLQVARHRRSRW